MKTAGSEQVRRNKKKWKKDVDQGSERRPGSRVQEMGLTDRNTTGIDDSTEFVCAVGLGCAWIASLVVQLWCQHLGFSNVADQHRPIIDCVRAS